ncbi:MAG: YdgA family protein [Elusimicrobiota bacterium]|nr:YdgA family protein [Elusimicrobiota bacterium]
MNKIIAGLVVLAIGLWAVASWWWFLWDIIRGVMAILFVFSGVTLIGLGLKNSSKKPAETK